MIGLYSVYNPRGEKIADCGQERDAVNLIGMETVDGTDTIINSPLPGDIVDVGKTYELPTGDIVVNMDGGVGGSSVYDSRLNKSWNLLT